MSEMTEPAVESIEEDEKDQRIKELNHLFMLNHGKQIEAAMEKGKRPQIFQDEDGLYHWLTRAERRKLMKMNKKGHKLK